MEGKKFSLKSVLSHSTETVFKSKAKIFLASIIVYVAFLLVYLITKSLLASFVIYGIFTTSFVCFLKNLENKKVENIFEFNKKTLKNLLLSMFFVFIFAILSFLFLVPGVIFFANFSLAFCDDGDDDIFEKLKNARQKVNGYKVKMGLLSLIYIFICLLCVGISIMAMWLFSLFIPMLTIGTSLIWLFINVPMFVFYGVFVGVSIFMIFVMPLLLESLVKFEEEIETDKMYKKELLNEAIENVDNQSDKNQDADLEKVEKDIDDFEEEEKDNDDFEDAGGDNSDYIF